MTRRAMDTRRVRITDAKDGEVMDPDCGVEAMLEYNDRDEELVELCKGLVSVGDSFNVGGGAAMEFTVTLIAV